MPLSDDRQSMEKALSVSAALSVAKGKLESFTVTVLGEVSEVSNKAGYKAVYFTVKDDKASMPCMMWLNRYHEAGIELRVGALVQLVGRFTLYAPKGRMNFDVFSLSLAGEGTLRLRVADLAKRLQNEGLMDSGRKKPLPPFPQRIGLVTSPRGAAVHDVLRTLRRRYPLAEIVFAGVAVEGDTAAAGLVEALRTVQEGGAEVVLLVRGGGSFEDLMPFNDEVLARFIVSLHIPVVTGIGHEPDTSIADLVADVRASTPTAAAEAVSPSHEALLQVFSSRESAVGAAMGRIIERESVRLHDREMRTLFQDPNRLFSTESQTLDYTEERLHRAIPLVLKRDGAQLERQRERLRQRGDSLLASFESGLSLYASRLHDLSPLAVLARGYAIAKTEEGALLKSVKETKTNDIITVGLIDGEVRCQVQAVSEIEKTHITWEE